MCLVAVAVAQPVRSRGPRAACAGEICRIKLSVNGPGGQGARSSFLEDEKCTAAARGPSEGAFEAPADGVGIDPVAGRGQLPAFLAGGVEDLGEGARFV